MGGETQKSRNERDREGGRGVGEREIERGGWWRRERKKGYTRNESHKTQHLDTTTDNRYISIEFQASTWQIERQEAQRNTHTQTQLP